MNFEFYFIRRKTQNAASDGEGYCRYSYVEEHEYIIVIDNDDADKDNDDDSDVDEDNTDSNIHDSNDIIDSGDNGKILERR
ncbi:hypothetical protein ACH3XW_32040 [Acanthocheilonema viteae]